MLLELEDPSLEFNTESIRFSNYIYTQGIRMPYIHVLHSNLLFEAWEVMGLECCLGSIAEGNRGDAVTIFLSLPLQQLRQPL